MHKLRVPTHFVQKLAVLSLVVVLSLVIALNRELEWFFRIPLVVFGAGATVVMAASLEECKYHFVLTEQGIELYYRRKLIKAVPWERVYWTLSAHVRPPHDVAGDLFDHSCFLHFRYEGMEKPHYLLSKDTDYRLGSVDYYTVQAFLICCPNAPVCEESIPPEFLTVDDSRLREKTVISSASHRFAVHMLNLKTK